MRPTPIENADANRGDLRHIRDAIARAKLRDAMMTDIDREVQRQRREFARIKRQRARR